MSQPAETALPEAVTELIEQSLQSWPTNYEDVPEAVQSVVVSALELGRAQAPAWQPMSTAPKDGTEVLLRVKVRAGVSNCQLVGHYMPGGRCIEDHPPIDCGWYFWNGCMFDNRAEPTHWMPLPAPPSTGAPR